MYYLMLHSHIHDLYWRESDREWVNNPDHATYYVYKGDAWAQIDYSKRFNPYGGNNHISIQQDKE